MYRPEDPLFKLPDPAYYDQVLKAGLTTLKASEYIGRETDSALKRSVNEYENPVENQQNYLGYIYSGPYSNLAGRHMSFIFGSGNGLIPELSRNTPFSNVQGFRVSDPPSAGDLMRGWSQFSTEGLT